MYRKEGVLKAVLGLFIAIYAYVWGWTQKPIQDDITNHKIRKAVIIWTICMLLFVIFLCVFDMNTLFTFSGFKR
jgi:CDP-diglyceride synthetase